MPEDLQWFSFKEKKLDERQGLLLSLLFCIVGLGDSLHCRHMLIKIILSKSNKQQKMSPKQERDKSCKRKKKQPLFTVLEKKKKEEEEEENAGIKKKIYIYIEINMYNCTYISSII